jgi:hypothetical protein
MVINTEIIRNLKPCEVRFRNYLEHYENFEGTLEDFILLDKISYGDKVWVFTKIATKEQLVRWTFLCASKVLSVFESRHPNDYRPRRALEAADYWLKKPSREAALNAYSAAYNARDTYSPYAAYALSSNISNNILGLTAQNYAKSPDTAVDVYAAAAAAAAVYSAHTAASCAAAEAYAYYSTNAAVNASEHDDVEKEVNLLMMVEAIRKESA